MLSPLHYFATPHDADYAILLFRAITLMICAITLMLLMLPCRGDAYAMLLFSLIFRHLLMMPPSRRMLRVRLFQRRRRHFDADIYYALLRYFAITPCRLRFRH